jgi:hypothetical protein
MTRGTSIRDNAVIEEENEGELSETNNYINSGFKLHAQG